MSFEKLRQEISEFLCFHVPNGKVSFDSYSNISEPGYSRSRISYTNQEGEQIPAYLLLPDGEGPFPAVLVHHQHNGQRHLGKSEVCGLAGNPLQAFGPALARQKIIVLAPDSICFEDRRRSQIGIEAHEDDVAQHYNEMCYRLLHGDTLMCRVLLDSALGISLLRDHPLVDPQLIGMLGHSYGGNTVLFHGALDERIRFACASGAACSYQYKMEHGIGIEMAEVILGFTTHYDVQDLVLCFAPRPLLVISADEDSLSKDATWIVHNAREASTAIGTSPQIEHQHYAGGHALTKERFDSILTWLIGVAG